MRSVKAMFRDLPIQRKIGVVVLLTSGTALGVMAFAVYVTHLTLVSSQQYRLSLGLYAGILALIWLAALALAAGLSERLLRLLSAPIVGLAQTAINATEKADFTVRIPKTAQDEVGHITDAFNDLLGRLEREAAALDQASQTLALESQARQESVDRAERLNQELMVSVRQAGMAEVATGVLHNVGNVLASANASVSLIETRLRQSRIHNLSKALALLREHRGELVSFLTENPKGRMLPGYLETLTDHLAAEQAEIGREMATLGRSLEHVKEIVSMQQDYARLCGALETLSVAALVQDAIRLNLAAFERHGITVVREFESVPAVTVDKHKVLQILVNLLRNAKYAMDELGSREKRLVVGIVSKGPGRVAISVRDNGIGIPSEHLARLFSRGFTTKRDGHGFGLHSGALVAKELGGSLSAYSEGIGKGATFTLELPVKQTPAETAAYENGDRSIDPVAKC